MFFSETKYTVVTQYCSECVMFLGVACRCVAWRKCLGLFFCWMEPKRVRPSTRKTESIFTSI